MMEKLAAQHHILEHEERLRFTVCYLLFIRYDRAVIWSRKDVKWIDLFDSGRIINGVNVRSIHVVNEHLEHREERVENREKQVKKVEEVNLLHRIEMHLKKEME